MNEQLPTAPPLNSQEQTIFDDVSPQVVSPLPQPVSLPATDVPASAAAARSAAVLAPPFTWQGKQLFPFTPTREAWWEFIREAAVLPPLLQTLKGPVKFGPDAAIIIWLCLHPPHEWGELIPVEDDDERTPGATWSDFRHNLRRFAAVCEEWFHSEIGVEYRTELGNLALQIYNRARITRAVSATTPSSTLGE